MIRNLYSVLHANDTLVCTMSLLSVSSVSFLYSPSIVYWYRACQQFANAKLKSHTKEKRFSIQLFCSTTVDCALPRFLFFITQVIECKVCDYRKFCVWVQIALPLPGICQYCLSLLTCRQFIYLLCFSDISLNLISADYFLIQGNILPLVSCCLFFWAVFDKVCQKPSAKILFSLLPTIS